MLARTAEPKLGPVSPGPTADQQIELDSEEKSVKKPRGRRPASTRSLRSDAVHLEHRRRSSEAGHLTLIADGVGLCCYLAF